MRQLILVSSINWPSVTLKRRSRSHWKRWESYHAAAAVVVAFNSAPPRIPVSCIVGLENRSALSLGCSKIGIHWCSWLYFLPARMAKHHCWGRARERDRERDLWQWQWLATPDPAAPEWSQKFKVDLCLLRFCNLFFQLQPMLLSVVGYNLLSGSGGSLGVSQHNTEWKWNQKLTIVILSRDQWCWLVLVPLTVAQTVKTLVCLMAFKEEVWNATKPF